MGQQKTVYSQANLRLAFLGTFATPLLRARRTTVLDLTPLPQDIPVDIGFDANINGPTDAVMLDGTTGEITFNEDGFFWVEFQSFMGQKIAAGITTQIDMRVVHNSVAQDGLAVLISREIGVTQVGGMYPLTLPINASAGDTIKYQIWTDSTFIGTMAALYNQIVIINGGPVTASAQINVYRIYGVEK